MGKPTCLSCGVEIPGPTGKPGGVRLHCSKRCTDAAARRRASEKKQAERAAMASPCLACEGPVTVPTTGPVPKYCSAFCGEVARGDRLPAQLAPIVCALQGCEVEFVPQARNVRCCSEAHGKALWRVTARSSGAALHEVPCTHCGTTILREPRNDRKPFCDYTCRDLHRIENPYRVRIMCDKPSWPDWSGSTCAIGYFNCDMCGKRFCGKPRSKSRRVYCAKRCLNAYKASLRKGRHKIRREAIFERDNFMCWLCDEPCDRFARVPDPLAPTIDHITPRNHGGGDEDDNLACAHFICNSRRRDSWSFPVAA